MGRPEGFLWSWPGMYSIVVPYHDTNDFFFSGHVGTCVLMILEYKAAKYWKMMAFTIFICVNQWVLMTFVKTHYIIDLATGAILAHYCHMGAEWISFWVDVKLLGNPGKPRLQMYYKPCPCCGWSNNSASYFMDESERQKLKELASEHRCLLNNKCINDSDDELYLDKKGGKDCRKQTKQ